MEREEAIKIVQSATVWTDEEREALAMLIPELAESEDKRIRKEIVSIVQSYRDSCISEGTHRFDDCLAWLEKQKHTALNEYDEKMRKKIIDHLESIKMGCVICTIDTSEEIAWLEKQKEPQNKSMAHEDSSWSGILTPPLCKDKNLDDIAQEYVEGVKEYNPTPDWNLIHTAVCYGYHLAEQKEQKPAEWSEEDEHRRTDAIYYLESAKSHYADTSEIEKTILWLKSLRPSWKPSEEQMEALLNAEGFLRAGLQHDSAKTIAELYEQLKKLRS